MRQKRISTGIVKLHCLRVAERARGGVKVYFGGSIRADGYALLSGEECLRIDGVLWSSDWREYLPDALQDIESMLSLGYASTAREAVELLDGLTFGQWIDDIESSDEPDQEVIRAEVIEPLTDYLWEIGIDGDICQCIYDELLLGRVPGRPRIVAVTGCTDWAARKALELLADLAEDYATELRIERLVSEIVAELE